VTCQRCGELGDSRVSIRRYLGERSRDRSLDPRRHTRAHRAERRNRVNGVSGQNRSWCRTSEGRLAREHLVEHAGEAVGIASPVNLSLACRLLRAHVSRGAEREPGLGESLPTGRVDGLGNPEIRHDRLLTLEQDVLGLDIAMDNPMSVGIPKRCRDISGDPQGSPHWQLLLPHETLAKGVAVDKGHRVPELARALSRIEDRQDVRVLQTRGNEDFLEEAGRADGGGQLGLELAGEIHGGHATAPELALDAVAVSQCSPQAVDGSLGQFCESEEDSLD
jgi:hypothetical protein